MIVVSDTTPLNYLVLIGQAHLLHDLYGVVTLPQAVHRELQREDTPEQVRTWIANRPEWLEVRQVSTPDLSLNLGAGEREAITLAGQLKADLILMDDRKARRAGWLSAARLLCWPSPPLAASLISRLLSVVCGRLLFARPQTSCSHF
jgi:predicted nucleic acid-binding protein